MNDPQAVVIGSGAGGSAFAWALANAGVRVLILEAGPRYEPSRDYRLSLPGWEQQGFPAQVETRGRQTHSGLQLLEERHDDLRSWNHLDGRVVSAPNRQFAAYHHVMGVGGSTLHYTGESHRMNPASMAMKSRFGVAADWPFDYRELEPWYLLSERTIGVAGPAQSGARWRSAPYPLPAHRPGYASQKLGAGFRKLGLSWVPNALASLSEPYDGRPPCNYCGQCLRGCPRYDKGTADITFIAKALATGNCWVSTVSRVLRLETGGRDRVTAAVYADQQGKMNRVEAELFTVACGAVETPRLLLNSSSSESPDGLGNESGQVGRNFMETLYWNSSGLYPEPLGSHRGLPADSICWDYNEPDAIPDVIGGCRFSNSTLEMDLAGPISYARRVVGGWGRPHKAAMREKFGRAITVGALGECLPGPKSRIDLDPEAKDEFDLPKARIHSHLDEMALTRLGFMARTCRGILEAAGVGQPFEEYGSYDQFNSTHVFGTCRMGSDAENSVVDPNCRSHRWRNLMVVDASVFPSSGGGESPSLTIYANALRAANAFARGRGSGQI